MGILVSDNLVDEMKLGAERKLAIVGIAADWLHQSSKACTWLKERNLKKEQYSAQQSAR